ncbi:MAG: nicotinate (nicotinamide) nucleotide adenylyltransferase [Oscillospiraceae bacterium]|nr:nicotinate (nicotinamide) nucleotide adenylyltransferase [Oscillospiraceae bacterium]
MKIGIYGGTFDPPHLGHTKAANAAKEALGLDRLMFIPTYIPPHKELGEGALSAEERLELTCLAAGKIPGAEVSDIETARGGRSYTVDTLTEIKRQNPSSELFLIMGTDMFLSVDTWREAERIFRLASLAVIPRHRGDTDEITRFAAVLKEKHGAQTEIIDCEPIDISSTQIREMLKDRRGRDFLDPEVYALIIKKRCFGAKPDFDWLREKAYAMLKEKRIPHVKGCEEEAVRLADRWEENEDDAREAAILHDITKKETLDSQLILCERYDIITNTAEKKSANLLHAMTGAAVAAGEFGVSPKVASAIRWHTTGRPAMTKLEKIIYMADYIEPTRDFEGLNELRRLAYEDLDAAVRLGLKMGLEDLKQRGIEPHPASLEALEYLDGEKKI